MWMNKRVKESERERGREKRIPEAQIRISQYKLPLSAFDQELGDSVASSNFWGDDIIKLVHHLHFHTKMDPKDFKLIPNLCILGEESQWRCNTSWFSRNLNGIHGKYKFLPTFHKSLPISHSLPLFSFKFEFEFEFKFAFAFTNC